MIETILVELSCVIICEALYAKVILSIRQCISEKCLFNAIAMIEKMKQLIVYVYSTPENKYKETMECACNICI